MTENIVVRDMDAIGARQAAELEKLCFASPWELEEYEKARSRDDFSCLCAYVEDVFAGFLMAFHVLDECHLLDIATAEKFRRRGVGTALIDELVKHAKQREGRFVYLEVREHNPSARALYEKLGFVEVGKRKDYYKYPADDAVLYTLSVGEEKL